MSKREFIFDDLPEAFDYCREAGHPVTVMVSGERWKLFPSGSAVQLTNKREETDPALAGYEWAKKNSELRVDDAGN